MQAPKPVPEAVKQGVESVGKDVGALPGSPFYYYFIPRFTHIINVLCQTFWIERIFVRYQSSQGCAAACHACC